MAILTKGTKVRHKTKGIIETIVGFCRVKVNDVWMNGVISKGWYSTGELMTFVRIKEDFEKDFEIWQH